MKTYYRKQLVQNYFYLVGQRRWEYNLNAMQLQRKLKTISTLKSTLLPIVLNMFHRYDILKNSHFSILLSKKPVQDFFFGEWIL